MNGRVHQARQRQLGKLDAWTGEIIFAAGANF
jgi:hypothetical protein